jgi:periplasmic divalent cation tolerance protein
MQTKYQFLAAIYFDKINRLRSPKMKKFSFVYITAQTKKEAKKIVEALVFEKLAACWNIFKIDSIYWWKGKIERTGEYGIFLKTKSELVEKIIKRVKEIHSYSVPCIVSFEIKKGNKDYLKWIEESTK